MEFDELAKRLSPEAERLFSDMAETYLASSGPHRHFLVTTTNTGTHMLFAGQTGVPFRHSPIDRSALNDLRDVELVRRFERHRNSDNYDLPSLALRFHQWLRQHRGEPVSGIEQAVRRLVEGDEYATAHPSSAHHLWHLRPPPSLIIVRCPKPANGHDPHEEGALLRGRRRAIDQRTP